MGAQNARLWAGRRLNTVVFDVEPASGRKPDQRAARPRDAATLILVRRDRGRVEFLMGQRHASNAFMPNKFVFPGGRLERGDYHVAAAGGLRPEVAKRLELGASPSRARALAIAAIRETVEETGLRLGRPSAVKLRGAAWESFSNAGLAPSLDVLDYVGRAITPPHRPRRFDARFFMADAHHIHQVDLDDLAGSGELLKLCWVTVEEAMTLDLPKITTAIMNEAAARLVDPDPKRPIPFVRPIRGKSVLERVG